jgi:ribosomal subunit interface protein
LDKFVSPEHKDLPICYVEIGKTTNHHKNGELFRAEFTVFIGDKSMRAESEQEDLYAALDLVTDEMSEELRSFKDKKTSVNKKEGAKVKSIIKEL